MATVTLGTAATTTLNAIPFAGYMPPADVATIAQGVKHDKTNTNPMWPGAFSQNGLLFIPNRGVLRLYPGDYVAVDSTGWPILLSQLAAASASWVHT